MHVNVLIIQDDHKVLRLKEANENSILNMVKSVLLKLITQLENSVQLVIQSTLMEQLRVIHVEQLSVPTMND